MLFFRKSYIQWHVVRVINSRRASSQRESSRRQQQQQLVNKIARRSVLQPRSWRQRQFTSRLGQRSVVLPASSHNGVMLTLEAEHLSVASFSLRRRRLRAPTAHRSTSSDHIQCPRSIAAAVLSASLNSRRYGRAHRPA